MVGQGKERNSRSFAKEESNRVWKKKKAKKKKTPDMKKNGSLGTHRKISLYCILGWKEKTRNQRGVG